MLGPDSRLLIALLITVTAALLVAVARVRLLPAKIACGALSILVAMTGGVAVVNYYYGYYTTWGEMWADLHGGTGDLGVISAATASAAGSGHVGWTGLPGQLSGYSRVGLVYLPPQYGQARYAQARFPVVELFHGTPGSPRVWSTTLQVRKIMDTLLARHLIGPMVLVMPGINGVGRDYQDCVNGPGVRDDTYLTKDVRADMLARYRVSHDPYEWGVAGYSSGGYCAANLALRHRSSFGAAAVIEGYFRAADGPAAIALNNSKALEAVNSPLYVAEMLQPDSGPVPAFWVAAGTHDKSDYRPATMFAAALDRIEQVPFIKLNAADNPNAWSAALPTALVWLWQQLAPPDLRVLFPVRTSARDLINTLPVRPVKAHHPAHASPATGPTRATGHGRGFSASGGTGAAPAAQLLCRQATSSGELARVPSFGGQPPRRRVKPSGITRSSWPSSPTEECPRPSRHESSPARSRSSTFSTPAWPLAARPHK
jgi:poly(3-hydroxybutyrate) depolymerase